jgi:integrase/recombinase XerD
MPDLALVPSIIEPQTDENPHDFAVLDEIAKSPKVDLDGVTKAILRIVRREHVDYASFLDICQRVRKKAGLKRAKPQRKLPQLLGDADLKRFFQAIQDAENIEHELMLRFLLFTSLRVSELVSIKVTDADLAACKVFIRQGKGSKDRYILFPASLRMTLASHIKANPRNEYLFESGQHRAYSPRRIQQIVEGYQEKAGIRQNVHPHAFRHQMLTWLTKSGLSDAQIQLISGHSSKKSLEVYQHLSLESVSESYQAAAALAEASLNGRCI